MLWNRFEQDKPYLNHFLNPVMDPGSGIEDMDALKETLLKMEEETRGLPRPIVKAKMFVYMAENLAVGYNPKHWFGANYAGNKRFPSVKPMAWISGLWQKNEVYGADAHGSGWHKLPELNKGGLDPENLVGNELNLLQNCGLTFAYVDYDHCVPDWEAIIKLGFPGLLRRVKDAYAKRQESGELTERQDAFYQGAIMTLEGSLTLVRRMLESARRHIDEDERMPMVCESFEHICEGRVESIYDAMQLNIVYYLIQNYLDHAACRSLGNLDQLFYPYYKADLESGRFTKEQLYELAKYFLTNIDDQDHHNNQPFYMGGTNPDGSSRINELSYLLLDAHDELGIVSPKLFLKISPNTPDAFCKKALDMIRRGHSSMVFINEALAIKSLKAAGATDEEALNFLCTGCYEIQVLCEENMTASVYCNLVKCLEYTLSRGYDRLLDLQIGIDVGDPTEFKTFDELFEAWQKETAYLMNRLVVMNNKMEDRMADLNPTSLFSSSIGSCVERGVDAFDHNGVKYNTSELMISGVGTLTDSLYILDKYVFREKRVSMADFLRAMNSNWAENPELREEILADPEKYGNDLPGPDAMLVRITDWVAPYANSLRTVRGGNYKTSYESIDFAYRFGEHCSASPDGRMDGDVISKNLSATSGQDRKGITAFIKSVTKINTMNNRASAPVDFVLHPSAVQGEEGLTAMLGILRTFMKRGGLSLQGNVVNVETLRDAQLHPENYTNLQVRLCGWNWYFNNMSRKDQDWFIRQAAGEQ